MRELGSCELHHILGPPGKGDEGDSSKRHLILLCALPEGAKKSPPLTLEVESEAEAHKWLRAIETVMGNPHVVKTIDQRK